MGPDSTAGKGCMSLFFLAFFSAGAMFCYFVFFAAWKEAEVLTWPAIPCQILKSESKFADPEKPFDPAFSLEIRYSYSAGGKDYESSNVTRDGGVASVNWAKIQQRLDKYKAGRAAQCYVNPEDPAEAALERGFPWMFLAVLLPMVFVVTGAGGLYFIWFHRAKRESDALSDKVRKGRIWHPWGKLALFSFLVLVGGWVCASFLLNPTLEWITSRGWKETPCTILFSRLGSDSGDDGTTYSVDVLYAYKVNGIEYKSSRYQFLFMSSSGSEDKRDAVKRYPLGARAVCYVNPSRPERAVLNRDFQWILLLGLLPLGCFLTGATGLLRMLAGAFRRRAPDAPQAGVAAVEDSRPRMLRPAVSGAGRLLGCGCFTLFWNGFVGMFIWFLYREWASGQSPWGPTLLMSPFVAVGLGGIVGMLYYFVALFAPKPEFTLTPGSIRLGGSATLEWHTRPGMGVIRQLSVHLIGREEATYMRGTNSVTDKEVFHRAKVFELTDSHSIERGMETVRIPSDSMHSFLSNHNKVVWLLSVKGNVTPGADIDEEFPIEVRPLAYGRRS